MKNTKVSAVKAKKEFTELLGRVATASETFTIIRRGKPVAVFSPTQPRERLQSVKAWLNSDDPFFQVINKVIKGRKREKVRRLRPPAS